MHPLSLSVHGAASLRRYTPMPRALLPFTPELLQPQIFNVVSFSFSAPNDEIHPAQNGFLLEQEDDA